MSLSKYLLIGVGAVAAGATLLYLARDTDNQKFDPKVNTVEKLLLILDELYLDYAGSYLFYYDIMLNQKEQGTFKPEMIDQIKARVDDLTRQNDTALCAKHNITPEFLQVWTDKYQKDARVARILKDIEDLAEQILVKQQVNEIHFDLPENLTRESYMQVSRKIQAAVRHSAYNHIHLNGKDKVTNEEMDQICLKIKTEEQDGYREKALALFGIQIPPGHTAKQLLQKAYVKFSTVSSITEKSNKSGDKKFYRSHFQVLIQNENKTHSELLDKIQKGERVTGIEKDPLLSAETDIVMEYNMIPGYLKKETTTFGDEKLRIAPHKGTTDAVKNVMDKFKQKKKAIDERKKRESENRVVEEAHEEDEEHKEEELVE